MQVKSIVRRVKGFYRVADYALRWGMIAPDAQRRLEILGFWQRHGVAATCEEFKLSRRAYLWRAKLRAEGGNVAALVPGSTAPKRRRRRQWPAAIVTKIRRLRTEHPNLAKGEICWNCCCRGLRGANCRAPARTIGRLIADAPDKIASRSHAFGGQTKPNRCASRACASPSISVPSAPAIAWPWTAHRIAPRTIAATSSPAPTCIRTSPGLGPPAVTPAPRTDSSAPHQAVFPFAIEAVLTDNGSEFQRHFAAALADHLFTHWHTYPKTPKMNALRTLQSHRPEECIDYHYDHCCFSTIRPTSISSCCATSPGTTSSVPISACPPSRPAAKPRLLSPVQFLHQNHQLQYVLARYNTLTRTSSAHNMRERAFADAPHASLA